MKYVLPALPYGVDALRPVISREALELHHGAHHKAYVDKLNDVLDRAAWDGDESVEQLLRNVESLPDSIREVVGIVLRRAATHANGATLDRPSQGFPRHGSASRSYC